MAPVKTYAVSNDWQIPWHDPKAVDLFLQFVRAERPHGVILNGDIVDCAEISDYDRDPLDTDNLQTEIDTLKRLLDKMDFVREKLFIAGNHEDRLRRYIWRHPELANVKALHFPSLFGLTERGWDYRPYGKGKALGKLHVTHGFLVRQHSAITAKAHFERLGISVLHGHTHRLGVYHKTNANGEYAAWENGCLCKMTPSYVQHPDWQSGFSVVHVDDSGTFNVQQLRILGRRLVFYGSKRYEARTPRKAA